MNPENTCPNCSSVIRDDQHFCPSCGQKSPTRLPSVYELVSDFFSSLFNLEFAVFASAFQLLIPGQLSIEYIRGRRKRYLSPIRFFLLSLIILLAVIHLQIRSEAFVIGGHARDKALKRAGAEQVFEHFQIARDRAEEVFPDQLPAQIADSLEVWMVPEEFNQDSVNLSIGLFGEEGMDLDIRNGERGEDGAEGDGFRIRDLLILEPDSVLSVYEVKGYWARRAVRQLVRVVQESERLPAFFVEKALWMVFLLIPLFAAWQTLMYLRSGRMYIEHLVFLFHTHAFLFLMVSLLLAIIGLSAEGSWIQSRGVWVGIFGMGLYILVGLIRYYRQIWIVTLIKGLVGAMVYAILSGLVMALSMVVSFLLF
jgi:hypothetical protein